MIATQEILDTIALFTSISDYEQLVIATLDKMQELTGCEGCMLYVRIGNRLRCVAAQNTAMNFHSFDISGVIVPEVILNMENIGDACAFAGISGQIVNVTDVYADERFDFGPVKDNDELIGYRTKSLLIFPLTVAGTDVIGVLRLSNAKNASTGEIIEFPLEAQIELQSICNIAAVCLKNIGYIADIKGLLHSFVGVLTSAIDERTPYNASHTKCVANYISGFIDFINDRYDEDSEYHFTSIRKEQLVLAALLHDIGKLTVPLEVMNKKDRLGESLNTVSLKFEIARFSCPDKRKWLDKMESFVKSVNISPMLTKDDLERLAEIKQFAFVDTKGAKQPLLSDYEAECLSVRRGTLTDAEIEQMHGHVVTSGRLLKMINFPEQYHNVPLWAKMHHELLDGSGYPDGVTEIPLEVCMLTIVDIYDALVASDRPYKAAVPKGKALGILMHMANEGKLHKKLVDLFAEYQKETLNRL